MADYSGKTYEFVTKNEIKSTRNLIELIIRKLQKVIRQNYGITFEPTLIGSAGRNLVTRIINGNIGFDFDYNFSIQKGINNYSAAQLKLKFIQELNKILRATIWEQLIIVIAKITLIP